MTNESTGSNQGLDPIKRLFRWKEATNIEVSNMNTEQLAAFIADLNSKINQIYDILMFPVENGRPPTSEEADLLLNPHKQAELEEVDRFVEE